MLQLSFSDKLQTLGYNINIRLSQQKLISFVYLIYCISLLNMMYTAPPLKEQINILPLEVSSLKTNIISQKGTHMLSLCPLSACTHTTYVRTLNCTEALVPLKSRGQSVLIVTIITMISYRTRVDLFIFITLRSQPLCASVKEWMYKCSCTSQTISTAHPAPNKADMPASVTLARLDRLMLRSRPHPRHNADKPAKPASVNSSQLPRSMLCS